MTSSQVVIPQNGQQTGTEQSRVCASEARLGDYYWQVLPGVSQQMKSEPVRARHASMSCELGNEGNLSRTLGHFRSSVLFIKSREESTKRCRWVISILSFNPNVVLPLLHCFFFLTICKPGSEKKIFQEDILDYTYYLCFKLLLLPQTCFRKGATPVC